MAVDEALRYQELNQSRNKDALKNKEIQKKSFSHQRRNIPSSPWKSIQFAREHRRALKEGDFSVFFLPFALALTKDIPIDMIASLPLIGPLAMFIPSTAIVVYLFVFLWGRGTIVMRYLLRSLIFLDLIFPAFPITTFCVWWAYRDAKKKFREANAVQKVVSNELQKPDSFYFRA